ncbi:MAG: tetraacyldisaccharide 4'-kinase [Nitrospirae bacterium]|nr:tetraacyldisaccharide 4'-kinase [Nitrospirota bacterium]
MNPFEYLYSIGLSIKKHYALRNQKKLPCKVISIGNITFGGTGKTPATIAIAEEAKKRGFKPCILTRGYKGKIKGPCFISKGDGPLVSEQEGGDEPVLMAEKLKDVPIIKCPDRYKGGIFAIQNLKSQISSRTCFGIKSQILFILDDGFQHWNLFRDRDILLIDGKNPFGNRRLLPLGQLREPLSAINRPDIIVLTKMDNPVMSQSTTHGQSIVDDLIEEIKLYNSRAPIFLAEHHPSKFITTTGEVLPLEWAKEQKFFGFCGIGNPESLIQTLFTSGVELTGFKIYRDHYRYRMKDLEIIKKSAEQSGANWIVTTEKDIMRLKEFSLPENLVTLAIEFTVDKKFYEEVFSKM